MLIVDTGILLAVADDADPDHESCTALVEAEAGALVTTALVVCETAWLIARQLGSDAESGFYRSIAAGDLRVVSFDASDWSRVSELVERYGDLPLGGVDASVVALAERLGAERVASLDRRDFSVVRPAHVDALDIVP